MSETSKKYVKKDHSKIERKVVSARVDSTVVNAFNDASHDAKSMGYIISMSDVVEIALRDAIDEFSKISGIDYLQKERESKQKDWQVKFSNLFEI